MMVISQTKIALAFVFCFSIVLNAFAQPSLKTSIDKTDILIGEQVKVKVVATLPRQDFFVKWIEIPDSLQHFEVVEKSKIDSGFTNQKLTRLSQTLTFTSFDSGKWVLPQFNIDFNPSNGDSAYNLYTDSFAIVVSYQQDTTNIIRDIKTIRDVKEEKPLWYWVAAGAGLLLVIALAAWLYYYLKKRKKAAPVGPVLSPYQQAIKELEKIQQLDLSDAAGVKTYHAKLTEVLKQYLASRQGDDFTSSTTAEVLMLLNQKGMDKAMLSKTAEAMRCSDAAKFAKFIPSAEESKESWKAIRQAIDFTEQLHNKTGESGT
jgi:hypothetical protein